MKKVYATKMINTGGRTGEVHSPDHAFTMNILPPGGKEKGATNPEQLFAAGYSACFNSALSYIKEQAGFTGESTIEVTVSLYNLSQSELPDVQLGVEIAGHIDGATNEETMELLQEAHKICPYSRATKGNIAVTINAY